MIRPLTCRKPVVPWLSGGLACWLLLAVGSSPRTQAADPSTPGAYLDYIRRLASDRWADARPPATLEEWKARNAAIRRGLLECWGGFPAEPCPLEARTLGTLERDGYRIEKLVFQTRPGIWMTANAYVPATAGKHPAILAVHGHWRGAKQDPVVQARCIGPAKLGFFVLAVDAFGAGERGIGKALGEYHGEMTGATLLPLGLPLSGLQVYENLRAVDYLRTRPEVDVERIGITGASGGGNQSMYAGAWDERLQASVPVCSVGTYLSYLGAACCICELVPGAVRLTEEWGILGLTAPRGLLLINATRDAPQFSVKEAKKTLETLRPIYQLYERPDHLRHAIFESPHDYSQAMRETMYGWMTLRLKGEGDGSPIPERAVKPEDPETLRCFPGDSRPDDWVTIPRFAASEARKLLAGREDPTTADRWRAHRETSRRALVETVFGGFPDGPRPAPEVENTRVEGTRRIRFQPEPGLELSARVEAGKGPGASLAILLDLDGAKKAEAGPLASEFRRLGWSVATLNLRATGALAWPSDRVGRAPDHNTAEWAIWMGRPLLGQWTLDVRRLLDALRKADGALPSRVVVVGEGPAGLVALSASAVDDRVTGAAAVGTLASFVTEVPYEGQRLGVLAPGILRVGDVGHLASLGLPKRIVVAGGVSGSGRRLLIEALREAYGPADRAARLLGAPDALTVLEDGDPPAIVRALRSRSAQESLDQ